MESSHAHRKDEHVSLAQKYYQTAHATDQFNQIRIIHRSLPEREISDISMNTELNSGLSFKYPFYIEAMTGGSSKTGEINEQLAYLAAKHQLAMASGSQSIALHDDSVINTFKVIRTKNQSETVIANLSASASVTQAKQAIDMLSADALELHINATQELIMPEGNRSFRWLENIERQVDQLNVPIIVKEVGFGMSKETIEQLINIGVQCVNVSGRGGTNFAQIENRRNHHHNFDDLQDWGQSTPESLLETTPFRHQINVIASGGVTSPLDVIKCGVLGADVVGVAGYFLHVLMTDGMDALDQELANWKIEIQRLLLLCGINRFEELRTVPYVLSPALESYQRQRNLM